MSEVKKARLIFAIFIAGVTFIFFPMMIGELSVIDSDDIAIPDTASGIEISSSTSRTLTQSQDALKECPPEVKDNRPEESWESGKEQ